MASKKIVIISSTQLSLNPRMVKEADALADEGYNVTVLYAYWNKWGADFDKILIPKKKWKAICIGGDPENTPKLYFLSRVLHKIAKILNDKISVKVLADVAIVRAGYFLRLAAPKYDADIYIGHNPGALSVTVQTAKKNRKLCGFDAEDFHRNEVSDDPNHPDTKLKTYLESLYFPQVDYLETSSPQIAKAYKNLFPQINPTVVLNTFPANLTVKQTTFNKTDTIKLFWFSQTIGAKRGLDDVVGALRLLKGYPFELHLLGHLPEETKINYTDKLINDNAVKIKFYSPIPSDELPLFASQFDIGLALEPAFNTNNDLALSNKIFTYLQAGLAIVASDTKAQQALLEQYPAIGKVYQKGNVQAITHILLNYHQNREKLFETRNAALKAAHDELNWENEKKKLIHLVNQTLERN